MFHNDYAPRLRVAPEPVPDEHIAELLHQVDICVGRAYMMKETDLTVPKAAGSQYLVWATMAELPEPPDCVQDPDAKPPRSRGDGDDASDETTPTEASDASDDAVAVRLVDGEAVKDDDAPQPRNAARPSKIVGKWRRTLARPEELLKKTDLFLRIWQAHEMYPLAHEITKDGTCVPVDEEIVCVRKSSKMKLSVVAMQDFAVGKLMMAPLIRGTASIVTSAGKGSKGKQVKHLPQVPSALAGKNDPKTFYIKPSLTVKGAAEKRFIPPVWAVAFTDDEGKANCHWAHVEMHTMECVIGSRRAQRMDTRPVPMLRNNKELFGGDELLIYKPGKKNKEEEDDDEGGGAADKSWVGRQTRKAVAHEKAKKRSGRKKGKSGK